MRKMLTAALVAVLAFSAFGPEAFSQKKPKIKETVTFATSWEKAIEEAKLLNVPIVVHSHGFY